jgi:hypothetical protein
MEETVELGIALLLIFILYLVDKHNRWVALIKIAAGAAILSALICAIVYGALFGWSKYSDYRARKAAGPPVTMTFDSPAVPLDLSQFGGGKPIPVAPQYSDLPPGATVIPVVPVYLDEHGNPLPEYLDEHGNPLPITGTALVPAGATFGPARPMWLPMDLAQEFGGSFAHHPVVPSQISEMHKSSKGCKTGSKIWGPDKVEWVCVQP